METTLHIQIVTHLHIHIVIHLHMHLLFCLFKIKSVLLVFGAVVESLDALTV